MSAQTGPTPALPHSAPVSAPDAIRAGFTSHMTPALAERNEALLSVRTLIFWYARRACGGVALWQDYEDIAHDAVVEFLRDFHPSKGEARNFVPVLVKHAAINRYRKDRSDANTGAERVATRGPAAPPVESPAWEAASAKLQTAMARLSAPVRQLLVDRFGLAGSSPKQLTELFGGLSRQTAHARVKLCVRRLRTQLKIQETT